MCHWNIYIMTQYILKTVFYSFQTVRQFYSNILSCMLGSAVLPFRQTVCRFPCRWGIVTLPSAVCRLPPTGLHVNAALACSCSGCWAAALELAGWLVRSHHNQNIELQMNNLGGNSPALTWESLRCHRHQAGLCWLLNHVFIKALCSHLPSVTFSSPSVAAKLSPSLLLSCAADSRVKCQVLPQAMCKCWMSVLGPLCTAGRKIHYWECLRYAEQSMEPLWSLIDIVCRLQSPSDLVVCSQHREARTKKFLLDHFSLLSFSPPSSPSFSI